MNEITLAELREHKEALESRLSTILNQEFCYFREQTGFSVYGISAHFTDITTFGNKHKLLAFTDVIVDLEPI